MSTDPERRVDRAAVIAAAGHLGQRDKQGVPYVLHVARVACAVAEDLDACAVAWMHDLFEDSAPGSLEIDDLRGEEFGWSEDMVEALRLVTKPRGERYLDYVQRIHDAEGRAGEIARKVKVADVYDNIGRIPVMEGDTLDWVYPLVRKYADALKVLEGGRQRA